MWKPLKCLSPQSQLKVWPVSLPALHIYTLPFSFAKQGQFGWRASVNLPQILMSGLWHMDLLGREPVRGRSGCVYSRPGVQDRGRCWRKPCRRQQKSSSRSTWRQRGSGFCPNDTEAWESVFLLKQSRVELLGTSGQMLWPHRWSQNENMIYGPGQRVWHVLNLNQMKECSSASSWSCLHGDLLSSSGWERVYSDRLFKPEIISLALFLFFCPQKMKNVSVTVSRGRRRTSGSRIRTSWLTPDRWVSPNSTLFPWIHLLYLFIQGKFLCLSPLCLTEQKPWSSSRHRWRYGHWPV